MAVLLLAVVGGGCCFTDRAPATPQRPTVSFDTSTTAAGTVELESGVLVDPSDLVDTPLTLKYGTGDDTELFVGWSPLLVLDRQGSDATGSGDVVLGARHRLWQADGGLPSAAALFSAKLPAASTADGLGSGQPDVRVGGVLNRSVGPVNANLFYQYGALGVPGGGTTSEHTLTLTLGAGLADGVACFAELAGVFVPAASVDSVFLVTGVAFAPEPDLVLDAGITAGLSDDAPDLQLFVGCTVNFGRLAR